MILNKVYEWEFDNPIFHGGLQLYTYQIGFGISARFLSCTRTILMRLFFGPFKLWIGFKRRK